MEEQNPQNQTIKILCPNLILPKSNLTSTSLQWLITSPFFPNLTIISTVHCLHFQPSDHPFPTPDAALEASSLRSLIIRGFHVTGALISSQDDVVSAAKHAVSVTRHLREALYGDEECLGGIELIGGVISGNEVKFFAANGRDSRSVEGVEEVVYVDEGGKEVWERGCLIKCGLDFKLPIYFNPTKQQDAERMYQRAHEKLATLFNDPQVMYILEPLKKLSDDLPRPVVIRGPELDFNADISNLTAGESGEMLLFCSYFFPESKHASPSVGAESADTIQVSVFLNKSVKSKEFVVPVAEYYPAPEEVTLRVLDYKLEVICYAVKHLPLKLAISKLIVPALLDQMTTMKNTIVLSFLNQLPQLRPFHFCPPGLLHPVTAIYEMSYGETELKQVEARRFLHVRLGLPSDRPLLRIANALNFAKSCSDEKLSAKKGYLLLKDVHLNIPSSGVAAGLTSLVQGSYEYHHYLQGGFDDNGWGCAYRSLQTIISWFRLQHYTAIDVPTHREIQEALVEIGDKDPSFIGSREWIGAIELSYVLDKLLGVSCKVINVRSGAELPEKCRELALHFETQGTPIMIGGGVLAYTLLGVDYNDASGDCAFLILDPHYTGSEDLKKIVNSGWCGWKKAVDSKGKSFFLADKFYNLLLPQRPDMV